MTDRLTKRLSLVGAMALGLSLAACAQSGFVDEGAEEQAAADEGNIAKSILISMGAIDDPHPAAALKFQPRPQLVVPPQRDLPAPVDRDAALASKGFPVDPEVRAERERTARLTGTLSGPTDKTISVDDQAKFKDMPVAPVPDPYVSERDAARALKPWELDGKAQAAALNQVENSGPAAKQRSLLSPPEDYRTPSPKAPLESPPTTGIAAMKPSWWPF